MLLLLTWGMPASATPETDALEDSLASGDIDGDDLAILPAPSLPTTTSGGHASVSLVGFSRPWTGTQRETGGLIVVDLPLERVAFTLLRGSAPSPASATSPPWSATPLASPQQGSASVPPVAEHASLPALPAVARSHAALHVRRANASDTEQVSFEGGSTETPKVEAVAVPLSPSVVRACIAAALRASGLGDVERGVDSIVSRARWSATLPEVRLRAVQYDDQRLYTDLTTASDASRLRDSVGAQVSVEARLTWRLDHLLFADNEPAFERIRDGRREARARVQKRVLTALFRWQRATVESELRARRGDHTSLEAAEATLRGAEAETTLDVLTGGWFSTWRSKGSPATIVAAPPDSPADPPGDLDEEDDESESTGEPRKAPSHPTAESARASDASSA